MYRILFQRLINRLISPVRYKERGYGFFRMSYTGIQKGRMAFSLKKAALKMA